MRRLSVFALAGLVAVPPSSAQSFKVLGSRALGMGGAQVAAAEGSAAQYWNPASLAVHKSLDVNAGFGAGGEFTKDLLAEANELADLATKIDAIQAKTDSSALTIDEYKDFLNALVQINDLNKPGLGLLGEVQGGGGLRLGGVAVSLNSFVEVGADPFVDTVNMGLSGGTFGLGVDSLNTGTDWNLGGIDGAAALPSGVSEADEDALASVIGGMVSQVGIQLPGGETADDVANELIQQASVSGQSSAQIVQSIAQIQQLYSQAAAFLPAGINPFNANQTRLTLQGANVSELALGWGGGVPIIGGLPLLKRLSIGANLKLIRAQVGYASVLVMDEDVELGDLSDDFKSAMAESSNVGLDLGALYDLRDTFLRSRFGVVARNVNRPSFDQPAAAKAAGLEDYKLDAQARAGLAWHPFNWAVVSADVDLTENATSLPGYKSRLAGAGVEVNVFNRPWLNLALRGGALKNVAESDAALAYTAGLGFNILHCHVDVGAALSSERVKIDTGDEIPSSFRVSANVGLRF